MTETTRSEKLQEILVKFNENKAKCLEARAKYNKICSEIEIQEFTDPELLIKKIQQGDAILEEWTQASNDFQEVFDNIREIQKETPET